MEEVYTLRETMAILNRSKATVLAYIHGGLLKAHKMTDGGRTSKFLISKSDLEDFERRGVPAGYYQKLYPRPHKGEKK